MAFAIYVLVFIGLVWLGWRRPSFGVAAVILTDPFDFATALGPTTMSIPKAAILGLAIGLLLRRANLRVLAEPALAWTGIASLAVVVTTALSITQADFHGPAIREAFKAFEYLGDFVLCALAFNEEPRIAPILASMGIVVGLVSVLALAQEVSGAPTAMLIAGHVVQRISGPLEGPNQLAGFLEVLLPPLLVVGLCKRASWWYIPVVALGGLADVLTFSRAGVVTCFVGIAAALFAARITDVRTWVLLALPTLAGATAAVVAVGGNISRFWSMADRLEPIGLGTRAELWSAAWRLYWRHPLLGIGAGNYEFELGRVGYPEVRTHANSQLLQSAVDGGVPLLAAFVWATLQPVVTLARNAAVHPLVAGMFGALVGLGLHQIFDDMTFFPKVGVVAWALCGVALAMVARGD